MNLADELNNYRDQAFDTWFDRWFEKEKLPEAFKKAAQQGYGGYQIELRKAVPLSEDDEYLNRRLRDPRTVKRLKENLLGIKVEFVTETRPGLFGTTYRTEKLKFNW